MSSILTHIWVLRGFFLIIVIACIGTHSDMGKNSSPQNLFTNSRSQFTTKNNSRVIAQKGGLAVLPCVVKLNSPATVSWIRRRDFQLLTVGLSTHSSDKRFLVEHTRHMGHWSLRIKSVREEDRGLYECQLSIYPTQSIFIELKIVEAVAEITGTPDIHIDEGSTLRLNCKLRRATETPAFVFWYHDSKMVNYDAQDGFFVKSDILKEPTVLESSNSNTGKIDDIFNNNKSSNKSSIYPSSIQRGHQQLGLLQSIPISTLIIQNVHFHHAGNYTCAPSNARSASVSVHVLQDEKPAAMQHYNRTIFDGDTGNNSINITGLSATSNSSYLSIKHFYFEIMLLYLFDINVISIDRYLNTIQTYFKFLHINR